MDDASRRGRARSKSAKLVDEACAFAYLARTMTRHFFALLALLTGLAAFGSPAQASLAEALACDSSIAAAVGDEAAGGESAAVQPAPATLSATRAVAAPERRPATPEALRLPVLMGIERAYE
jgi:hypothetical protein